MGKKILSKEEVLHLAKLVKLTLDEGEVKKYQKQLGETLDYIKNLKELKTKKTNNYFSSFHNAVNVFFKDEISKKRQLFKEDVFKNAKKRRGNYFIVERIL